MIAQAKHYTVEEFDKMIAEDVSDDIYEYVTGEIYKVPSNPYVSAMAGSFAFYIIDYLRKSNIAGHVTGAAGGYKIGGERFAPDVAFVSAAKQDELTKKGYNTYPPDLAVEVISDPNNRREQTKLRQKLTSYLNAGVLVRIVDPEAETVEVYQAGQVTQIIDAEGTLEGGEVLPGFALPLREIFPKKPENHGETPSAQ